MSTVEPAVAVKTLLYSNWSITSPAQDVVKPDTSDPAKVHFTNRWFAPVPQRLHPHQVTVRPFTKPYRALQLGSITKYSNFEALNVHVWVLPSPKLTLEDAHTDLYNMLVEIRRIIRILGETAGSGIQHILLGAWQDRSRLDQDPPQLHMEARATAIIFEMSNTLSQLIQQGITLSNPTITTFNFPMSAVGQTLGHNIETYIASDPRGGLKFVATWPGIYAYYSIVSPASWTANTLSTSIPFFDPCIGIDRSGNTFYGSSATGNGLELMKGTSITESSPILTGLAFNGTTPFIRQDTGATGYPCGSRDFPRFFIDTSASSPYVNNIYFVINGTFSNSLGGPCFDFAGLGYQKSTDGSTSWTSPKIFAVGQYALGNQPLTTDSTGNVYIYVSNTLSCLTASNAGQLYRSSDGGQTFTSICIPMTPGAIAGSITSVGNTLHVIYRAGQPVSHMYDVRSTDQGSTWTMPVRVDDVLSPDNTQFPQNAGAIPYFGIAGSSSADHRVDVAWYDYRNNPNASSDPTIADVYYSYISERTAGLFAPNIRLTPGGPYSIANGPGVLHGNDFLTVTNDNLQAYVSASLDTQGWIIGVQFPP